MHKKKGRRHCSPLLQAPPQTYYNSPKELIGKWDIPYFPMPFSIFLNYNFYQHHSPAWRLNPFIYLWSCFH